MVTRVINGAAVAGRYSSVQLTPVHLGLHEHTLDVVV